MLLKDLINPRKWFDFLKFKFLSIFGYLTPQEKHWQSEVIVYRGLQCPDCKNNGKCIKIKEGETEPCGCDWIGKSTDMSLSCSLNNWGVVKDFNDWEKFKKNRRIFFTLKD
jgi:hypothetical protein